MEYLFTDVPLGVRGDLDTHALILNPSLAMPMKKGYLAIGAGKTERTDGWNRSSQKKPDLLREHLLPIDIYAKGLWEDQGQNGSFNRLQLQNSERGFLGWCLPGRIGWSSDSQALFGSATGLTIFPWYLPKTLLCPTSMGTEIGHQTPKKSGYLDPLLSLSIKWEKPHLPQGTMQIKWDLMKSIIIVSDT